jgi:hypothetical protein
MAEAGILREDDGVELIEGEIVEMALIGTRLVIEFNWLFSRRLNTEARVSVQNPVPLGERLEPRQILRWFKLPTTRARSPAPRTYCS